MNSRRVAGAVGKEHRLGRKFDDFFGGENSYVETVERETLENRRLRAVVDCRAFEQRSRALEIVERCSLHRERLQNFAVDVELIGCFAGDFLDVVDAYQALPTAGFCDRLLRRNSLGRKARLHCADAAELLCDCARVDPADCGHAALFQIFLKRLLAAPATRDGAYFAHDKALDLDAVGFFVRLVHAVVAHFDRRHCNDLTEIGRVCKNFLVARHRRIEYRLADDRFLCAERASPEDAAVFECQNSCVGIAHNIFTPIS